MSDDSKSNVTYLEDLENEARAERTARCIKPILAEIYKEAADIDSIIVIARRDDGTTILRRTRHDDYGIASLVFILQAWALRTLVKVHD